MKTNCFWRLHVSRAAVIFCAAFIAAFAPWRARASCVTATSHTNSDNFPLSAVQTHSFTAYFDATPSTSPLNAFVGLSKGAPRGSTGFAVLVRFSPTGQIDALKGGAFAAASAIRHFARFTYHFRVAINMVRHTYSIYVTPAGGSERTVGIDYPFPAAQRNITQLDHWGIRIDPSNSGSLTVCNFNVEIPSTPVFSPAPGAYTGTRSVTIISTDATAIHYTINGTTPTIASTLYAGTIALPLGTTALKAIAVNAHGTSAVAAGTYILTPLPPPTPVFSPVSGTYAGTQSVTITSAGSTSIYYTTDGSVPTNVSALYTTPVAIANNTVLKAIGENSSGTSSVASASFTILHPSFSLSAASASPTVLLGESTRCTITAISSGGFGGTVILGVSGLPSGVTGTFSPVSINGAGNSTLTISAPTSASTGTYPLTVTGACTSPSLSFAIPVTLNVSTNASLQQAIAVVSQMSLAEEISQVHGSEDAFSIRYIPASAHAPQYNFTNGPAGIGASGPGHGGPATAMPAPIALAATFDVNMAQLYGSIVGQEAVDYSNDMIEGPDINIARVPQNGRTFEAYGEDPYLVGQIAVNDIEGIQAQGISAESKHFAGNNQETNRLSINDIIDERTLREIYLPAFEATILQGHVDAVMGAYNQVNGFFCCENMLLLHDILKGEWGFTGYATSDFGATHSTIPSALAGLDAEMPTAIYYGSALQTAVTANQVPKAVLDEMLIRRFSTMINRGVFHAPLPNTPIPAAADGAVARQLAEAGIVLLKNNGGTLPLQVSQLQSIALIGPFATSAMTGGGGSSFVSPNYTISPLAGIQSRVAGSGIAVQLNDGSNIATAVALAQSSTVAIIMVGDNETEGVDDSISLSGNQYPNQDALVQAVAAANPHTVVVLKTGTAVLMPWVSQVPAILEAWYPGEEDGNAVAAVLFGDVNPSGKLPLTFPVNVSDCPANTPAQYPGVNGTATYSEGIFVGYRHYDASNITPLFPFGHGLSYTTFKYQNLAINPATTSFVGNPGQTVSVDLDITNTGPVAGSEVAQIYVGKPALPNGLQDAPQWLKGFQKISITPGQTGHVHIVLNLRSFAYWDVTTHAWLVAPGNYSIYVGSSSRDIRLVGQLTIN
jgi:beta-glucosidase